MIEKIEFKSLLEYLKKEIEELQGMDEYSIDKELLNKKISKSKTIAYIVSVAIQVLDKIKLESEIEELRAMIEELKNEKRDWKAKKRSFKD